MTPEVEGLIEGLIERLVAACREAAEPGATDAEFDRALEAFNATLSGLPLAGRVAAWGECFSRLPPMYRARMADLMTALPAEVRAEFRERFRGEEAGLAELVAAMEDVGRA